jgi:hypothetical protein
MSLTCDLCASKHVPQEVNPAPQDLITLDSICSTQFGVSNNRGVGIYSSIGTYTLKGAFTLKGNYKTEDTFLTPLFSAVPLTKTCVAENRLWPTVCHLSYLFCPHLFDSHRNYKGQSRPTQSHTTRKNSPLVKPLALYI